MVVADVLAAAAQNENDQIWDYPETEPGIVVNYRQVRLSRAAEPGIIGFRFSRWLFRLTRLIYEIINRVLIVFPHHFHVLCIKH
jgi:hypothetical protein